METKIDLSYADDNLIFRISSCSVDKKYSFFNMDKEGAKTFLTKLRHLEDMRWSQIAGLPREKGLTLEKVGSDSYRLIDECNLSEDRMFKKHYFHVRIDGNKFRIFGYQDKNTFCITHIDKDGIIHHT